jgi:hypothetical protein
VAFLGKHPTMAPGRSDMNSILTPSREETIMALIVKDLKRLLVPTWYIVGTALPLSHGDRPHGFLWGLKRANTRALDQPPC